MGGEAGRRWCRAAGKSTRPREEGAGSDRCRNCTWKACPAVAISLLTEPSFRFAHTHTRARGKKKIIFKHSPPAERPQSYPRVIIVWKLASECVSAGPLPPLAWSSRHFGSLGLISQPYIAFHVQQFPQTYPTLHPTPPLLLEPTYGDQLLFAGASNKCLRRRYERAGGTTHRFIPQAPSEERAARSSRIFFNCARRVSKPERLGKRSQWRRGSPRIQFSPNGAARIRAERRETRRIFRRLARAG